MDPLDASFTILYVNVSPLSPSEPSKVTSTAVSSSVEAATSFVVGVSSTEATVIVTVEVLLSSVPSLALKVKVSVPL